jgi:hypothetical protein
LPSHSHRAPGARQTWAWLALILLAGLILRFYQLDHLPPGLFGDEALVTLHARAAVDNQTFPIYFAQADGGFHPAVVYLTMLARALTSNHPYAVRFGVAAASLLSLPVVFAALRAIFELDFERAQASALALVGAFCLAITFPFVLISRVGFEVSLPILAGAAVFWALAVAVRTGQRWPAMAAGLALGLGLYTYYSARLLPVAVVIALAWVVLARGRDTWRAGARQLGWITACACLAFAPLGWYFWQHPDLFLTRAATTSAGVFAHGWAGLPGALLTSTLRTLASLSLPGFGDVIARHNLPGRAVFDVCLSVLFWLGLLAALLKPRRRSTALLVAWWGVMLLPVILTLTNNSPHFTRMMGAMPAMAGLAALGAGQMYRWLAPRRRVAALALLAVGLTYSLGATSVDYFGRWANRPELFDAFQLGDWRAAQLALADEANSQVYLSPQLLSNPAHAAFNLLLAGGPVRDFPGPGCLVYFDQPAGPLTYIIDLLNDQRTAGRLAQLYGPQAQSRLMMHAVDPWPLYAVVEVPAGATPAAPTAPTTAVFGGALRLVGYSLSAADVKPGETLTLTVFWQALTSSLPEMNVFVHLYQPGGDVAAEGVAAQPVAQSDGPPCQGNYPTTRWAVGEIVADERQLTVPPDFAADRAPLAVGLYRWPDQVRVPPTGSDQVIPGDRLRLTELRVTP